MKFVSSRYEIRTHLAEGWEWECEEIAGTEELLMFTAGNEQDGRNFCDALTGMRASRTKHGTITIGELWAVDDQRPEMLKIYERYVQGTGDATTPAEGQREWRQASAIARLPVSQVVP